MPFFAKKTKDDTSGNLILVKFFGLLSMANDDDLLFKFLQGQNVYALDLI